MTTSEPTTGEIVEAIRACEDRATCHGCIFLNCKSFDCNSPEAIADRLESQEREIERLKTAIAVAKNIIANRTDELLSKTE